MTQLGPDNGTLTVRTGRGGAAAKAGHDLLIEVERWSATLDDASIELTADAGSLRVLDPHTVAYLDIVGSGAETIAHLRDNGRIVIMLCAFEGPPRIVRLHGRGEVVVVSDPRFEELLRAHEFPHPAVPETRRAIVIVELDRIADSCGYGVPLMSYQGGREHLDLWAAKKMRVGGPEALLEYEQKHNSVSIDGLPAVDLPVRVSE